MPDQLPRYIPPADKRDRYGTWHLSSDRAPDEAESAGEEPRGTPELALSGNHEHADEEEVRQLIRRQRRFSLLMALLLLGPVFAIVVAAVEFPNALNTPIWHGFSISFLAAAVFVYPVTWTVAIVYAIVSNRMDGLW